MNACIQALLCLGMAVGLALGTVGCSTPPATGPVSITGEPLTPPPVEPERRAGLEWDLELAATNAERYPQSEDAAIWHGRRLAYVHRYEEAVAEFSRGLAQHPWSARLLRHRGHRCVTLRRFDDAIADLERAAALTDRMPDEVEPDGAPNIRNVPRSTLKTNIWYHLALARYLKGDFAGAAEDWRRCLALCANDDMRVAAAHWLYTSLTRAGRPDEAAAAVEPLREPMRIIENGDYHRLVRMYRGEIPAEEVLGAAEDGIGLASAGYGVAMWRVNAGDRDGARDLLERIVRETPWPAFGHIAAEADLARWGAAVTSPETPPEPASAG